MKEQFNSGVNPDYGVPTQLWSHQQNGNLGIVDNFALTFDINFKVQTVQKWCHIKILDSILNWV